MKEAPAAKKKSRKKLGLVLVIVLILIVAAIIGVFAFMHYQKTQAIKNNPQAVQSAENEKIVVAVGKLMKLPSETPSVATVSDITKLQSQTLFQNAQNGDKVLIFDKAKRAIVYRPSENLIVEIGNVVVEPGAEVSPQATKVKVVLYNGTGTAGYAKSIGSSISSKFSNMEIAGTENASSNYEKTVVVDLTGKNKEFAESVAKELDGEVKEIPDGEEKPSNADILIILGN